MAVRRLGGAVRRLYFLQHWFMPSDPAVEAVYDLEAIGVDLGRETAPNETTMCRFCHRSKPDLDGRLIEEAQRHLAANGLKPATVDATQRRDNLLFRVARVSWEILRTLTYDRPEFKGLGVTFVACSRSLGEWGQLPRAPSTSGLTAPADAQAGPETGFSPKLLVTDHQQDSYRSAACSSARPSPTSRVPERTTALRNFYQAPRPPRAQDATVQIGWFCATPPRRACRCP